MCDDPTQMPLYFLEREFVSGMFSQQTKVRRMYFKQHGAVYVADHTDKILRRSLFQFLTHYSGYGLATNRGVALHPTCKSAVCWLSSKGLVVTDLADPSTDTLIFPSQYAVDFVADKNGDITVLEAIGKVSTLGKDLSRRSFQQHTRSQIPRLPSSQPYGNGAEDFL
jgi:hypothetical protein